MTLGSSATLQEAHTEEQIAACFPVIQTLRLHFTNEADFVSRVLQQQQEDYHLLYIEENGVAQALAGYRIREDIETPHPKFLYVADLASLPAQRGKGYGKALMSEMETIALNAGCKRLILDSGVQRGRAHKFYFNAGLTISSYRFEKTLS